MTEAARLRTQAERCLQLAQKTPDKAIADALSRLAVTSLERATDLERRTPRTLEPTG
jgi:hypothetical protein